MGARRVERNTANWWSRTRHEPAVLRTRHSLGRSTTAVTSVHGTCDEASSAVVGRERRPRFVAISLFRGSFSRPFIDGAIQQLRGSVSVLPAWRRCEHACRVWTGSVSVGVDHVHTLVGLLMRRPTSAAGRDKFFNATVLSLCAVQQAGEDWRRHLWCELLLRWTCLWHVVGNRSAPSWPGIGGTSLTGPVPLQVSSTRPRTRRRASCLR